MPLGMTKESSHNLATVKTGDIERGSFWTKNVAPSKWSGLEMSSDGQLQFSATIVISSVVVLGMHNHLNPRLQYWSISWSFPCVSCRFTF
jgi:hypothetical protein